jgi:hypothetical protein
MTFHCDREEFGMAPISAAVFALLRGTRLPTRLSRTLEGEAGFNDPIAVSERFARRFAARAEP